jgi:hypothetical protein
MLPRTDQPVRLDTAQGPARYPYRTVLAVGEGS